MIATIHVLSSESDICSLLHFGCLAAKWQTLFRNFRTFSVIFFGTVSDYTHKINIVQDRSLEGGK